MEINSAGITARQLSAKMVVLGDRGRTSTGFHIPFIKEVKIRNMEDRELG